MILVEQYTNDKIDIKAMNNASTSSC